MAVTDDAIAAIKKMIVDGDLAPGDRLPREADLAERLGLSRSSLREAVRALALIKVLDVRHGDGTYVTGLDPATLMNALGFVVDFHRDDSVLQFLQVRRILEPAATAMATVAMSTVDIAGLAEHLDTLPPSPRIDELVANDVEFHARIAAGSGNPLLCSLLDSLSSRTQRARMWRGLSQDTAIERTLLEHRAIQRAMAARDPETARSWATVHIAGLEDWLRTKVAGGRPPDPLPAAPGEAG
ncbi:FadR/GntR family transcriptional regulator [Rhizomonospora bruguierae]|uniref:FadR/GntR family transcriptional regulator n=1 Tax=Rhizomonospora bruguierae TaxID=1581705 RepID=UPI001BCCCF1F|nr:FCD domain-containing protein [Micromonospora sp. NBRC 107566]